MNTKHLLQTTTVTLLLTTVQSAFALSCIRPDPVQSCKQMQSDNQSPVWVNGTLRLKRIISQETRGKSIGGKGPAVAEYIFTGDLSDKSGKRAVKGIPLTISTSCAGPWCASLPQDNKSGYFLMKGDDKSGLKLNLGACSFQPFQVTAEQVKAVEACVTPKPVKKPEEVKNNGGSQIFTQKNKGKNW